MKYFKYLLFITLILFNHNNLYSQLIIKNILSDFSNNFKYNNEKIDTISMPFFDDFSTYDDTIPKNNFWSRSKSILIKDLPNNNSPSIGVAVFDGINQDGNPYNESSEYTGLADTLSSNFINLESFLSKDSIFLSFLWKINNFSEFPDDNDSIRLQFLNKENKWETIWKAIGNLSNQTEYFNHEIFHLQDKFLHRNYRFRFQNFGKLNGPFDSWVIDYIYLNNNRNSNDTIFIDRTLTYKPNNIFGSLTSIPMEQFLNNPDLFLDSIHVGFNNLNNQIQPIEFNCIVYDIFNNSIIDTLSWKEPLNPIAQGFERRILSSKILNKEKIPIDKDSLHLKIKFYINSGDTIINGIDYRVNDTVININKINNYLSYDDEKAEFAAGINQEDGEVVVMFILNQKDTITHIDLYFPKIYPISDDKKLELVLYKKLNDNRVNLITNNLINVSSNNNYNSFKLISPLIVNDTIYIGYKQFDDEFIPIGLDKNNNNSDKIFFNINGSWEQNNLINGSLMIRPKFSKVENFVTKTENLINENLKIYPNPSYDKLNLNYYVDYFYIYDQNGKELIFKNQKTNEINLKGLDAGVYIIILKYRNRIFKKRVIKLSEAF